MRSSPSPIRLPEDLYRTAFHEHPHAMWIYDAEDLSVLAGNAAALGRYGVDPAHVASMRIVELHPAAEAARASEWYRTTPAGTRTWTHVRRDGVPIESETVLVPLGQSRRRVLVATEPLRHDALTGLPNRLFFHERVGAALARGGTKTAVIIIDLDHFKLINDTFGHASGDAALQAVARLILVAAGGGDDAARLGSDEFGVVLPVGDAGEAVRAGRRIFDALAQPLLLDGKQVHLSATVGIAVAPCDGDAAPLLVRNAERAMHSAKDAGRGRVQLFTPEMREEQARRAALESDLRRALDRDELVLRYQPIYDCASWELTGVEALLRWQHPTLGLLPPDQFISIAEATGLIVPIGAWVLRQACLDVQRIPAAGGRAPRVSVNISARQLQEAGLMESVREIVEETGIDPHRVELEITESVAMQNAEATLPVLHALKEMGVSVAVDDFGTGYSSLLYLTRFPIDTVKVDRQFVGNVTRDESSAAVVGAVVALAHSLQLRTIAEGVETPEQRDFLLSHMCTAMQGYLFSRAVPIEELVSAEF